MLVARLYHGIYERRSLRYASAVHLYGVRTVGGECPRAQAVPVMSILYCVIPGCMCESVHQLPFCSGKVQLFIITQVLGYFN